MFQHTPYDIHPDHLNKWFLSFWDVFKGVCGVCSNGITKFHHWNRETSSSFSPISGYLLLTVQRRSLKSTLPAEKGQLWVSWLPRLPQNVRVFGVWTQHLGGVLVCWVNLGVHRVHLSNKKQWKLIQLLKHGKCIYKPIFFGGWLHLACQGTLLLAFLPPHHPFEQSPVHPGYCLHIIITLTYKRNKNHQTSMYH